MTENKKQINWRYEVGDRITGESTTGKLKYDFIITNRETRLRKIKDSTCKSGYSNCTERFYEYTCNICSAKHLWKNEFEINRTGCLCCSGKIRIKGINTIGDIYPEYIPYFIENNAFDPSLRPSDKYKLKCPVCGHIKYIKLESLSHGFCCDYCNSIGNKRPDLIKYFVNKENAFKVSYGSGKDVYLQCPDCGNQRYMAATTLNHQGFCCKKCNDHLSFPEKFILNMLDQLNINFITQLSSKDFKWCNKFRYDFYIPENSIIIETHGEQHYVNGFESYGGKSIKEEQENDKNKKELAIQNNVKFYITLDCRKSSLNWIKNSILNSELNKLYDLSNVKWKECAVFASKNIIKEICEYWNIHNDLSTKDLSKIFHIGEKTIRKYLKNGTEFGWCKYDVKKEVEKRKKKVLQKITKQVLILKDDKCIGVFDSPAELSRKSERIYGVKLDNGSIYKACKNRKAYKGFTFEYVEQKEEK